MGWSPISVRMVFWWVLCWRLRKDGCRSPPTVSAFWV